MIGAVGLPVEVGVGEAEVGGEVDDAGSERGEVLDAPLRFAVREGQEEDVARGQLAQGREAERLAPARRAAGSGGGEWTKSPACDSDVTCPISTHGCAEQQPEQLAAAVARTADDRDVTGVMRHLDAAVG